MMEKGSSIQETVERRDGYFCTKSFVYSLRIAFAIAAFGCFGAIFVKQERLAARLNEQEKHLQEIKQLFNSATVERDEDGVFIYFSVSTVNILQQWQWIQNVEENPLEENVENSDLARIKRAQNNTSNLENKIKHSRKKSRKNKLRGLDDRGKTRHGRRHEIGLKSLDCVHPATHMTAPSDRKSVYHPISSDIFFEWSAPSSVFSKPGCQIRPYNVAEHRSRLDPQSLYQYLEINTTGLYFVYSQLRYDDAEGRLINNGHETVLLRILDLDADEPEKKILMSSYTDQTSHKYASFESSERKFPTGLDTNYHGGVFLLNSGDLIGVRPLSIDKSPGYFLQSTNTSFFGAICMQKFEDEGVFPDNYIG